MEPPQPEPRGPVPEEPEPAKGKRGADRGGPAVAMEDERDERRGFRLPPPQRPPYTGLGLFIGAGVAFSVALSEQIIAHVLVKRRCIEPFAAQTGVEAMTPEEAQTEAEDFGQALLGCAPGVLPAVVLRVQSDLGLLATIGLASAGAALRAHRKAYDDVFGDRPALPMMGLRIAGISLLSAGVVTWLTTGALSWGLLASCRDAKCATRARLMAFTTRDTGAVLVAAGAGMVTYAIAHRRAYDRFYRDRALSVGTALLPGGAGLSISGRF
jgi:hypothetical protein